MSTPPELERIGSGRAAEVFAYGEGRIIKLLRQQGGGEFLAREADAQRAAREAGVAAPDVFGLESVDRRTGIVMERVDGLDGLTALDRQPWRVWAIGHQVGRLHRQLAEVRAPESLRTLRDVIRERVTNSARVPNPARLRLLALLDRLPDGDRLCHMDFHPGNVLESPQGPVVIDFANAMRGDPLADHARSLVIFRAGEPADDTSRRERWLIAVGRGLARIAYQRGYGRVDGRALQSWEPVIIAWRLDEGVPEERTKLLRMLSRALRRAEA